MKLGKVAHRARFLFLAVQAVLCRCETAQWLYMNRALSDCLFGFLLSSPFKDVYPSPDRPTLFRLLPRCFPGFPALTSFLSVCLAKTPRRYPTSLSAKTAVELARYARGLPCASCVPWLMGDGAGRPCSLLRRILKE